MANFFIDAGTFAPNQLDARVDLDPDFVKLSGTGTVTNYKGNGTDPASYNNGVVEVSNTDFKYTDLVFESDGQLDAYADTTGASTAILSFATMTLSSGAIIPQLKVEVFQAGALLTTFIVDLKAPGKSAGAQWVRHGLPFNLDGDDFTYTFRYTFLHNGASPVNNAYVYVSGFCVQLLNEFGGAVPPYTPPVKNLRATASVTFGAIAAGDYNTASATVQGAQVGDFVIVGLNQALSDTELDFTAYVSAANTVVIKAKNTTAGSITAGAIQVPLILTR